MAKREETPNESNSQRRLLLRAAYIASYIELRDDFPHDQQRNFWVLEKNKWPISIPKDGGRNAEQEELVNNINNWFETNYIVNVQKHIYNPAQLAEIYKLMNEALGIPEDEEHIVEGWLAVETAISTEPSISAQKKKYGLT